MKFYGMLAVALFFCSSAVAVIAQETDVDIVGTIRFYSTRVTQVQSLSYGVGSKYTDSTDPDYEEMIPPFPPPGGYLIVLDRACSSIDGDPPCYWKQDFRGVPDSIQELESPEFSIEYDVLIVNNSTGAGVTLSILAPDWPPNVDSIHFVDVQLPKAFNHTFTGPGEAEVTDEFTKYIKMTVYYNLNVSSIKAESVGESPLLSLGVRPNPVEGNEVVVNSAFQAGDRVVVADMLGCSVAQHTFTQNAGEVRMGTAELSAGSYMIVHLNRKGEVLGRNLLQINR